MAFATAYNYVKSILAVVVSVMVAGYESRSIAVRANTILSL